MPNCFSLAYKSDPDGHPVKLQQIDDEMRRHFGAEPDPDKWYEGWYDYIGFALACGRTFEQLRERYTSGETPDPTYLAIVNWLDETFTADCWAEVGRH